MGFTPVDAHWRDTARPIKFFFFDARAVFPMLLCVIHARWWTFWTAIGFTVFFAILARYGFTIPVFFRAARSFLAGGYKVAQPWWRY